MEQEKVNECVEEVENTPCTENKEDKTAKKKCGGKKWQEELDKQKAEAEENKRKWYAVTAEYENYRRRTQNQAAQRYNDGRNDVVASLFPIGDNLERALLSCLDENTKQGLDMILKAYKKVLEGEGVEEINPQSTEEYDPETDEELEGLVIEDRGDYYELNFESVADSTEEADDNVSEEVSEEKDGESEEIIPNEENTGN